MTREVYMFTKRCTACRQVKLINEFSPDQKNKDGYKSQCKTCRNAANKSRYHADIKKTHAYYKNRYQSNRDDALAYQLDWQKRNRNQTSARRRKWIKQHPGKEKEYFANKKRKFPQKIFARSAVNNAVKNGILPRIAALNCAKCGKPASEYHHYLGYKKKHRLDVIPLCRKCHSIIDH